SGATGTRTTGTRMCTTGSSCQWISPASRSAPRSARSTAPASAAPAASAPFASAPFASASSACRSRAAAVACRRFRARAAAAVAGIPGADQITAGGSLDGDAGPDWDLGCTDLGGTFATATTPSTWIRTQLLVSCSYELLLVSCGDRSAG